jgi:hypothetical protein
MPITFYPNKGAAQQALVEVAHDERISHTLVQFEPNNGWVAIVVPKPIPCGDLADLGFEVRDGIERPSGAVRPPRLDTPKPRGEGGGSDVPSAPSKGATARVWAIADETTERLGKVDRAAIMAACEAAGINPATAGTQYSKWKKARG